MVNSVYIKQGEVLLVNFDPQVGKEINKIRPCLVVSPNEMNKYLQTYIVVPMTTKLKPFPTRIHSSFQGKDGSLALDQIKTIDAQRVVKSLGTVDTRTLSKVKNRLIEMFS